MAGNDSDTRWNVHPHRKQKRSCLLKQRFFGNHYDWDHDFDNVFSNQINGSLSLKWWQFQFIPKISLTTYSNYVYFGQDKMPNVAADANLISQLGGEINLFLPTNKTLGYGFRFKNEVIFTEVSAHQARHAPRRTRSPRRSLMKKGWTLIPTRVLPT